MYFTTNRFLCLFPVYSAVVVHFQPSVLLTWMDDRILPALSKSGVTSRSVRLLHTSCTGGTSISKLCISGITSLQARPGRVCELSHVQSEL